MATQNSEVSPLTICGEMTIYSCGGLRDQLAAALRGMSDDLVLDLSAVSEMDGAGLQLLLWAKRFARAKGRGLVLSACSPSAAEALQLAGISDLTSRRAS